MIADLVVISLAVFLITKVLFETTGPFDIFSKSRDFMSKKSRNFTIFFTCIWCQVAWFGLFMMPEFLILGYKLSMSIFLSIATAGLAGTLRFLTINKGGL